MIKRYSIPEMVKIWDEKEKYRIWFQIEAYACEAMEKYGYVPKGTTKDVMNASKIDYDIYKINEIEKNITLNSIIKINIKSLKLKILK